MIYLYNQTTSQNVKIPKTGLESGTSAVLTIRSTTENKEIYSGTVTLGGTSHLVWTVAVTLTGTLKDGEIEYQLKQSGKVVASGVGVLGDYTRVQSNSIYQSGSTIEFKQYGR